MTQRPIFSISPISSARGKTVKGARDHAGDRASEQGLRAVQFTRFCEDLRLVNQF